MFSQNKFSIAALGLLLSGVLAVVLLLNLGLIDAALITLYAVLVPALPLLVIAATREK